MGSGNWLKTLINRKKAKQERLKKSQIATLGSKNDEKSAKVLTGDAAATRIQTAFHGYKARKTLRDLIVVKRLQSLIRNYSTTKQASVTLIYLQSWSRIKAQISARRLCMVTEGRIKQKKLESQLKMEAKLQDLDIEWCGGSETMEEIVSRIQQREEAAVKRERAMAYAFTHQWRANSGPGQGHFAYEFGKGNWGWSWTERWIAARPWEIRLPPHSMSANKTQAKSEGLKKAHSSVQKTSTTFNGRTLVRRLSDPTAAGRILNAETDADVVGLSRPESNSETATRGPQMSRISG